MCTFEDVRLCGAMIVMTTGSGIQNARDGSPGKSRELIHTAADIACMAQVFDTSSKHTYHQRSCETSNNASNYGQQIINKSSCTIANAVSRAF
mmetsp:Transcript_2982/g.4705  ORF Transcript_2982/g.4705 Transcript_2982/m.4705 type:complete len:93 (+) Transcript_2982:1982-2260(+)